MNVLEVQNLFVYRGEQPLISNLSFHLAENQRLFIQGDIGTGKSTLLHCLLGFIAKEKGTISWFGHFCQQEKDFIPLRGEKVGICFQQADDQLFGPTVLDDVAFGLLNLGKSKAEAYATALAQLEYLDIAHLQHRSVNILSGGEKNFVALAGVLAMQPKVLLLDEPTNNLAQKNIAKLTALLQQLNIPMLIVSHDLHFSRQLADDYLLFD